ncbi:hypothetical protein DL93DRAFT_2086552 [Clavulina sp. PMI_390]|nr:hypothetical protein DL93DRAFT_2086552 [Clavulina sp. PMI_390]
MLRLTLSSDKSRPLGFTYLRSCQLQRPILFGPTELEGHFVLFRGLQRQFILWNWVEDTWGVATSRPDEEEVTGRTLSSLIVAPGMIAALKSHDIPCHDSTSELLLFGFPKFFSTQEEARREENITRYPLLQQLEIVGGEAFLIRLGETSSESASQPMMQEVTGAGTLPVMLHLIRNVNKGGSHRYLSTYYKLSFSRIPGGKLLPASGPWQDHEPAVCSPGQWISSPIIPREPALLPIHLPQVKIQQARFQHTVFKGDRGSMLYHSPLGDIMQVSLENSSTEENFQSPWFLSISAAKSRLFVEALHPDDFTIADRMSFHIGLTNGYSEEATPFPPFGETTRFLDLGEASRPTVTYIDWWNGAIVEQVGNSHLLVRNVIWRM